MARITNDATKGMHGAVGKAFVYKTRKDGKTYATKYPDKTKHKSSKQQAKGRSRFSRAVEFAQSVIYDPARKAAYNSEGYNAVYYAAIADYMKQSPVMAGPVKKDIYTDKFLSKLKLNKRQIKVILYMRTKNSMTNSLYQRIGSVSKATATRDMQDLVSRKIFESSGLAGAGATYTLIDSKSK